MNVEPRLRSLEEKHHGLETKIELEGHRPQPDQVRLSGLKREKLRIREEIQRLQS
ncbi:MAG: DUF465 domain-containing protein [Alphaproteobacteria bacterium]|nr:MAG: DUF465 domain-containing protein [Alphaproteobacteria bacterium]